MDIEWIKSIKDIIGLVLVYVPSVTIAGALTARRANRWGDSTAVDLGYGAFDPRMHVDPIGMMFLLIGPFGWGRTIPIDPFAIDIKRHDLKVLLVYLTGMLVHVALMVASFCALVFVIGGVLLQNSPLYLAHESSLSMTLKFLLIKCFQFNFFYAVIACVRGLCDAALYLFHEELSGIPYLPLMAIFVPLIIVVLYAPALQSVLMQLLVGVEYVLKYIVAQWRGL